MITRRSVSTLALVAAAALLVTCDDDGTVTQVEETPESDWVRLHPPFTEVGATGVWGFSDANGLRAAATAELFLVGGEGGSVGAVLHYDGTHWTKMEIPASLGVLRDVWGTAPNDVFTVGDDGGICHWNGLAWEAMESDTDEPLHSVWGFSGDDVIAVGDNGTIVRLDGDSWSREEDISNQANFRGVWGSAPNDIFAVGYPVAGDTTYVVHFNGTQWTPMSVDTESGFKSIWGPSPNEVFAAGWSGVVFRYDGSEWTSFPSPTTQTINTIWGFANDDFFVGASDTKVYHFNGSSWESVGSERLDESIYDIWGNGNDNLIVTTGQLIHEYDGNAWRNILTLQPSLLSDLWGTSETDVFCVGSYFHQGIFLQFDGTHWREVINKPEVSVFTGVWRPSPSDTYVTTGAGQVYHYEGSEWTLLTEAGTGLFDIWGTTSDIFAVGGHGTIIHFDGSSWREIESPTTSSLLAVSGSAEGVAFAVGVRGTILRYDGKQWNVSDVDTEADLHAVWAVSSTRAFAVGDGVFLSYDGARWNEIPFSTTVELHGVWGTSEDDVYAVGGTSSFALFHYDGKQIHGLVPPGRLGNVGGRAIWGTSSGEYVFAAGEGATIIGIRKPRP